MRGAVEAKRKFIGHGMMQNKVQKELVYSIVGHGMMQNDFQMYLVLSIVTEAVEAEKKSIVHGRCCRWNLSAGS